MCVCEPVTVVVSSPADVCLLTVVVSAALVVVASLSVVSLNLKHTIVASIT